jgi:hypothetical protein
MRSIVLLLLPILILSCVKEAPEDYGSGMGKKPIYIALNMLEDIKNLPSQALGETGTIFWTDTLFFILEYKKGIHVYSIADTALTLPLTFFAIPAITDFAISGNYLYADGWKDLLIIDITNIYNIQLASRTPNAFEPSTFPPLYNGTFECYDPSKGAIAGWEDVWLEHPLCITIN